MRKQKQAINYLQSGLGIISAQMHSGTLGSGNKSLTSMLII